MGIAENIKRIRGQYGMSQKDFGAIAGVSDKAVSTWENGTKEPRMGAIQKIADHFGLKKSDIIEDNEINSITTPAGDSAKPSNKIGTKIIKGNLVAGGLGVAAGAAMLGGPVGVAAAVPVLAAGAALGSLSGYINYLYTHADAKTKKQMPIIVEGQTEKELMEAYRLLPQKDKETVLSLIQSLSKNATADRERIRRTLPQKDDDKK